MKVKTLEIAWHAREPVLSVDFHPSGRLATAGADNTVRVSSLTYILNLLDCSIITFVAPLFFSEQVNCTKILLGLESLREGR